MKPWSLNFGDSERKPVKVEHVPPPKWTPWRTHQEYIFQTEVLARLIVRGMRNGTRG